MSEGSSHGFFVVGTRGGFDGGFFLAVAVHQHDGVVHRKGKLQDCGDSLGDVGDFGENEVGARVNKDGETDGKEKEERLDERVAEDD